MSFCFSSFGGSGRLGYNRKSSKLICPHLSLGMWGICEMPVSLSSLWIKISPCSDDDCRSTIAGWRLPCLAIDMVNDFIIICCHDFHYAYPAAMLPGNPGLPRTAVLLLNGTGVVSPLASPSLPYRHCSENIYLHSRYSFPLLFHVSRRRIGAGERIGECVSGSPQSSF